jgi:hypothetical protein
MRRALAIFLFVALAGSAATAQFTTVSGTVTDPNGLPYANGTISAALVISGSPTLGGIAYTPPTQPTGLNTAGSFTMRLADNTQLSPGGSTWSFTVSCAAGCIPVSGGKGPVSFTVTGVTISGVSQSITATLTAAALALSNASGGGLPANPVNSVQFNNGGAFGGDANLTWNNSTKQLQYGTSVGPSTFSIASNAYITGFPLISSFTTTTDTTSTVNGPLALPNNFSMDINPATGSQTTEAWTLNALAYTDPSNSSTFTNELVGMHGEFDHRGSGLVTNGYGLSGEIFDIGSGNITFETGVLGNAGTWTGSTGNINTASAFVGLIWNAGSGTITNGYGLHVFAHTTGGATGTITNMTGIQIDDINVTGVTNPLAINVAANDSNLGPAHTSIGLLKMTGPADDAHPTIGFYEGGTSNVPGFEVNGSAGSSAIMYGLIDGVKLTALDFNFGLTMVDQSGLGFASSGLSRNSGFFPLAASTIAVGNGNNADTSGILVGNHGVSIVASLALTAGQPVKIDTTANNQVVVTTTADTGGGIAIGFVRNSPAGGASAFIVTTGFINTPILGTGTCATGNFVIVDTTTNGRVMCTATYTAGTVLGKATQAQITVGNAVSVEVGLR